MNQLTEVLYPELRRIAARRFRAERAGHALQPTALVHEAYVRLVANEDQSWRSRTHFLGAAAEAMRRVLVDHARARDAEKRGGAHAVVPIDAVDVEITPQPLDVLELDLALGELTRLSARQARIVELRYFAGLSLPEIAETLGLHVRTVDRDWATAKAWLRRRLRP